MALQVAVSSANRLLREALAAALTGQSRFRLAGLTHDLPDLERLCRLRPVDVVVVDGDLEGAMSIRAKLRSAVLTYESLPRRDVVRAVSAGVTLVPYSRGLSALAEAVGRCPPSPAQVRPPMLTDRDLEILSLSGCGYSVKEMARMLGITASTVENHMRRIFAKTDGHNRAYVVSMAARLGLLWHLPVANSATLVVVFGRPGSHRDRVVESLIKQAVPVLVAGDHWTDEDDASMMIRKPVVAVLIDESGAWHRISALGAKVVVVSETAPDRLVASPGPDAVVAIQDLANAVQYQAGDRTTVRSALTQRELEILRSISRGHSVRQTAQALAITAKTVENIQARLFCKLDVRNRAEALAAGYELGLITEDEFSR